MVSPFDEPKHRRERAVERALALQLENRELRRVLDESSNVDHVVGMLMLLMSCGADVATEGLEQVSLDTARDVRDLAYVICARVAHGNGLPPEVLVALERVLGRPLP